MKQGIISFLSLIFLITAVHSASPDTDASELYLPVEVNIQYDPPAIEFTLNKTLSGDQEVEISRKLPDDKQWQQIASSDDMDETPWTDNNIEAGQVYSYQFILDHGNNEHAITYLDAGIDIPPVFDRGTVLIVCEEELDKQLGGFRTRFKEDLAGDGWAVRKINVSSEDSVPDIKSRIDSVYDATDGHLKSVILMGNVPVPYSGNTVPDGHENDHKGAWPADVYYADLTGEWTDETVDNTTADREANHNVPGDGKFDQSIIPGEAVLQIGRIDLSDLPAFEADEDELIKNYLQRNHEYRHGKLNIRRKGLIDENFSENNIPQPGAVGWRNMSSLVGPDSIVDGDYFTDAPQTNYLFAYASGPGTYTSASGVGNTNDFAEHSPNSIFTMLFGSYFGDWDNENNFLRAPLASNSNILTSTWTGWPPWTFHPMGMGETVGRALQKTQNNQNTYRPFYHPDNQLHGGIFLALHGDPTLRMHTVEPPTNYSASFEEPEQTVVNTWEASPDPDVIGYHVFRSNSLEVPFERLTDEPINQLGYFDDKPVNDTLYYMIRAVKKEHAPTGTYYNLSQGVFSEVNVTGVGLKPGEANAFTAEIYPNPATEQFTVSSPAGIHSVTIFDMQGRKVTKHEGENDRSIIVPAQNIRKGIYIAHIETSAGIANERLIIGR